MENNEFEYLLDEAIDALDESNVDKSHIEIIMQACGKSRKNNDIELLDSMFKDFDKIFRTGNSAPL